jgi:hypothetical protein
MNEIDVEFPKSPTGADPKDQELYRNRTAGHSNWPPLLNRSPQLGCQVSGNNVEVELPAGMTDQFGARALHTPAIVYAVSDNGDARRRPSCMRRSQMGLFAQHRLHLVGDGFYAVHSHRLFSTVGRQSATPLWVVAKRRQLAC